MAAVIGRSRVLAFAVLVGAGIGVAGCKVYSQTTFPNPNEVFITTGDGNIQRPYTPVGALFYNKTGFRIPLPLLGYIPIVDVDPDAEMRAEIYRRVRAMGGDALINMRIVWEPAKAGWLGLFASGGSINVTGMVIRR